VQPGGRFRQVRGVAGINPAAVNQFVAVQAVDGGLRSVVQGCEFPLSAFVHVPEQTGFLPVFLECRFADCCQFVVGLCGVHGVDEALHLGSLVA